MRLQSPWRRGESVTMTTPEPNDHAIQDRRAATADPSWMLWTAIGIGGIWVGVLLISLFAPDLVSGSEQQHLPLAAFTTWFWRDRHPGLAVGDGPAPAKREVAAHLDRACGGDARDLGAGHDPRHHAARNGDRDRP